MQKYDAIRHVCATVGMAYHTIGDYQYPSDGFCSECQQVQAGNYQNNRDALRYVRLAVLEKLRRDGYTPKAYRNGKKMNIDEFASE